MSVKMLTTKLHMLTDSKGQVSQNTGLTLLADQSANVNQVVTMEAKTVYSSGIQAELSQAQSTPAGEYYILPDALLFVSSDAAQWLSRTLPWATPGPHTPPHNLQRTKRGYWLSPYAH